MRTLTPYRIARLLCDARYAGVWFATDGEKLRVVYRDNTTPRLPDDMKDHIRRLRPLIIAALQEIPDGCRLPTVFLLTGRCDCRTCKPTPSEVSA